VGDTQALDRLPSSATLRTTENNVKELTPEQKRTERERDQFRAAALAELDRLAVARRRIIRTLDGFDNEPGSSGGQKRPEDDLPGGNASLKAGAAFVKGDTLNLRGHSFLVAGVARHTLTLRLLPRGGEG